MTRLLACSIALGVLTLPAPVAAQSPNVVTHETTTRARVDRLEKSIRVVTLVAEGNLVQSVYVDPAVKAFDDLKVGDKVTVRYVESAVVKARRNAELKDLHDSTAEAQKADANVVQQLTAVVTIESIDPQGLSVTYRTADGRKMMRPVPDPKLVDGLRSGDRVEVTLTRARAISIEPDRR